MVLLWGITSDSKSKEEILPSSDFSIRFVGVTAVGALLRKDPQQEVALLIRLEGRRDD